MKLKRPNFKLLSWPELTLLGMVGCAVFAIGLSLCVSALQKSPEEIAQKNLEYLSKEYYVTYLYPRLLRSLDADPADELAQYADNGIPTVFLRQLLNYNNDADNLAPTFDKLACNTNQTAVRYYPVAPYGPSDYTVRYYWHCENGDFPQA